MPRRSILSAIEPESLLAIPTTGDELIRLYTLNEADLALIRQHCGAQAGRQELRLASDDPRAREARLLTKCEASGNTKAVSLITRMSSAAWRHILLNGHYTFQSGAKMIDLDTLLAGLDLG